MSLRHSNSPTPRPRLGVSARELLLGAAILAIGGFMTMNWLRHPDGHTLVRRLGTGVAAIVVGVVVLALSFRRSGPGRGAGTRALSIAPASQSVERDQDEGDHGGGEG